MGSREFSRDKSAEPIFGAIQRLDSWIEKNGWAGWDPYDIKEVPFYLKLQNLRPTLLNKIGRKICFSISELFPLCTRKYFKVSPRINAKGMGLFLAGYANLYKATKNESYLRKALDCADWLIRNRNRKYSGWSWGYPFDWQSVRFIPRGTPSSVVTSTVGDGFFLLYEITGDKKYLDICQEICGFFLENLNVSYEEKEAICYSYTPIDDYQVHNANLFVGEFLVRIGKEIDDGLLINQGIRCGNFALKEQQAEGCLPYWGLAQIDSHSNGKIFTDHYHSGFEVRMLYKLWKHTGRVTFQEAYLKYYRWYLQNMFLFDYIPKMTPDSLYPINIHSCAEALLCQTTLLPDHRERHKHIRQTLDWITKNMEFAPGRYAYLIKKIPLLGEWKLKIPMIRWGQAWMFRALSEIKYALVSGQIKY